MKTQNTVRLCLCLSLAAVAVWAQESGASDRKAVPAQLITPSPQSAAPSKAEAGVGDVAPDFVTKDLAGKEVRLADYKGKVVVLDFWATWCGPCLSSMPHTQEVAKRFKDKDVVVLAACTSDSQAAFEKWVKENASKYPDIVFTRDPNAEGEDQASRKLYGVTGIPTQFVIDREGKIVASIVGYSPGDKRLEEALGKAGVK
ncbi:MAG TPA: TlpA family protein disulfide reductase [Verrucomicrobia bacterium]|nr:TlpA family protein disulfide reductase [Verrucomicrobiota bacterium]HOP98884.1 TlpA disulfide reductase family protein [Verrucomicrobiota bacterium]HPU54887.1 TlpA disulfide reductase family protein [Verrucomicrobiota bacterium]